MRIYEMTATFGKLNHETLTLKPGLNIIEAPNEWGKSTWCAFLLAMFYGLDTRAKTTKAALSDKEHYLPWSGQPMSGRILLHWQGKDITIERSTTGRVPMGTFSAYETATGLPIPELNSDNCGEMLLNAEQSVFRRAGFLKLSDLPVTRDDALMRRLNGLVTTGDESGDGDRLMRDLKALRNKCRYHKSGLLPQTEEMLAKTEGDLQEFFSLQNQSALFCRQAEEAEQDLKDLQNHLTHLKNQEAREDAARVSQAKKQAEEAKKRYDTLKTACLKLPPREDLLQKQDKLQSLAEKMDAILNRERELQNLDPPPAAPGAFTGMSPNEAVQMAEKDRKAFELLKLNFTIVWILAGVCCAAASVLCFALQKIVLGVLFLLAMMGFLAGALICGKLRAKKRQALADKYGDENAENWILSANFYLKAAKSYEKDAAAARKDREALNEKLELLKNEQNALCGSAGLQETLTKIQKMLYCLDSLAQTQKEYNQAKDHLAALTAMAKRSCEAAGEDALFLDQEETDEKIREIRLKHQKLLSQLGQCQGRMEALGTEAQLRGRQAELQERIHKLQEYYDALNIAISGLEEASAELQRRFAPRIIKGAQKLMGIMTDGRYERLNLSQEFALTAGTESEDVLKNALYRSEGTIDQLYFSLRLSVARELTPDAPLILDDALCRFDEKRLQKALEILSHEKRQVILFTCQSREGKLYPSAVLKM